MKLGETGRTIRLGVVGLGLRSESQLEVLLNMPDVEIAVVCDEYEDRVKVAQEHAMKTRRHGLPRGQCPGGH